MDEQRQARRKKGLGPSRVLETPSPPVSLHPHALYPPIHDHGRCRRHPTPRRASSLDKRRGLGQRCDSPPQTTTTRTHAVPNTLGRAPPQTWGRPTMFCYHFSSLLLLLLTTRQAGRRAPAAANSTLTCLPGVRLLQCSNATNSRISKSNKLCEYWRRETRKSPLSCCCIGNLWSQQNTGLKAHGQHTQRTTSSIRAHSNTNGSREVVNNLSHCCSVRARYAASPRPTCKP
jgi:hypothetical protein